MNRLRAGFIKSQCKILLGCRCWIVPKTIFDGCRTVGRNSSAESYLDRAFSGICLYVRLTRRVRDAPATLRGDSGWKNIRSEKNGNEKYLRLIFHKCLYSSLQIILRQSDFSNFF